MKSKITLVLFVLIGVFQTAKAQSVEFQTYTFKCAEINTTEKSIAVQNHLSANYAANFSAYVADLTTSTATITTNVAPLDVMQIFRQLGYEAFFIDNGISYYLSYDGLSLREPKQ